MHPSHPVSSDRRAGERGVALILGILFTVIVVGLTAAGSLALKSHQTTTKTNFVAHGQAVSFARSGLIEALGWLRKQTSQPVTAFNPVLDPIANPPVLETIDPDIGIVREFKINGAIWGRYEVWKDWPGDPDPERLAWRNQMRMRDVSGGRGNLSPGSVWKIRSVGYVFRRVDGGVPFNQLPNQILGQEIAEVETRRLALQPPGQAALSARRGSNVTIGLRGRVVGGSLGAGIYYPNLTGAPALAFGQVSGSPPLAANSSYADTMQNVFGVSLDELKAMADVVITNPADFPSPIPHNSLVVCEAPTISFDDTRPLRGTGVVVFTGNVTVLPGSNSAFSGLLYAAATLDLRAPVELQGAVVALGTMSALGVSDFATITYDDQILNSLRHVLGSYRLAGAVQLPLNQER